MPGMISRSRNVMHFFRQHKSDGREIVTVSVQCLGKDDLFEWMQVEVFLGNVPWQMRFGESASQKERLIMRLTQLGDRPGLNKSLAEFPGIGFNRFPFDFMKDLAASLRQESMLAEILRQSDGRR